MRAEEDAAADAADNDPRPRRWNHALVVFTAVVLVITALGFGIVDGCLCGPSSLCSPWTGDLAHLDLVKLSWRFRLVRAWAGEAGVRP